MPPGQPAGCRRSGRPAPPFQTVAKPRRIGAGRRRRRQTALLSKHIDRRPYMRRVALLVMLFAASLFADDTKSPLVTVPLTDYQKLTSTPQPSTTVVDTIELGGSFHDNRLTIAFNGRAVGVPQETEVVTGGKDLTISGCSGTAIVTRAPKGAFHVLPLRDTFSARCDLRLAGSDRVQLHVAPTVLGVRSTVSDGELTAGEDDSENGRTYALVRQVAVSNETLPV